MLLNLPRISHLQLYEQVDAIASLGNWVITNMQNRKKIRNIFCTVSSEVTMEASFHTHAAINVYSHRDPIYLLLFVSSLSVPF